MRFAVSEDLKHFSEPRIVVTPQKFEEGIEIFKKVGEELAGGKKIMAIAGGIAGPFDERKRSLLGSPNLKDWIGRPFTKELEEYFGASVFIENDAALAGLGEAVYGAGKNYSIVAYLTVSTGVGGARIVNQKIDEKTIGFEPGHQIIDAGRALCPECEGCTLGRYISGNSIEKRMGKKPEEIDDTEFWDRISEFVAYGVHNMICFWSPDVVVLGGSLMKSINIHTVEENLKKTFTVFPEISPLKHAELGDLGGLYGAMAFLKERGGY